YSRLRLELEAQSQQLQKEIADRLVIETALQKAKETLERQNKIDSLTLLSSRHYFDESIEGTLAADATGISNSLSDYL
ncbi:MAG: hypothetical protein HC916_08995, partial [Coleofasciculaceae cyanobacterium SM2_1_6]|nr:hypothetical protein [Coleofasciculaceae cyanobacterium SM2_1_6]